jgi:hypothetical protein
MSAVVSYHDPDAPPLMLLMTQSLHQAPGPNGAVFDLTPLWREEARMVADALMAHLPAELLIALTQTLALRVLWGTRKASGK